MTDLVCRPENPPGDYGFIQEAFALDSERVLQLTKFKRSETRAAQMSADRQRILFYASTNELGTNPFNNCQLFSIDRNGGDLRQLTHFDEGEPSLWGCSNVKPPEWTERSRAPGCLIRAVGIMGQDPVTDSILFGFTCDPFGTNPNGGQIFAVRPDGTVEQLTHARGMVTAPDGMITVELPGPAAAPVRPR